MRTKLEWPDDLQSDDVAISLDDLWLRCFALGTMQSAPDLVAFLHGRARTTRHEREIIAVALHEYLIEIGAPAVVLSTDENE